MSNNMSKNTKGQSKTKKKKKVLTPEQKQAKKEKLQKQRDLENDKIKHKEFVRAKNKELIEKEFSNKFCHSAVNLHFCGKGFTNGTKSYLQNWRRRTYS